MNFWQFLQWTVSNASENAGVGLFLAFCVVGATICFLTTVVINGLVSLKRK